VQPGAVSYCPRCDTTGPGSLLGALLGTDAGTVAPRLHRGWRRVGAGLAAVAITASAIITVTSRVGSSRHGGTEQAEVSNAGAWAPDPVLRHLAGYVERARGLLFLRPVTIARLDPAAFRGRVGSASLLTLADSRQPTATLRAFGLINGDKERTVETGARLSDQVGSYDIVTKQVYVRADLRMPYLGFVLVHELTHALQDQHFDLSRPYGDNADAVRAAISLVEGDAERVARSYLETLPPDQLDEVSREALTQRDELYRGIYLQSADTFPYVVGETFVRALVEGSGQARLDAAFRAYPTSTAQVLHVERYLHGDQPLTVAEPRAGGIVVERGVLGEFDLYSVLQAGGLDVATASRAADGWDGARYVTWLKGGRACARVRIAMDTAADTARLATALRRWVAHRSGRASLFGTGPLTLDTCERG